MNERKLKQLNILVIAAIFIAVVASILFATKFSPENENPITGSNLEDFNSNWVLRDYRGEDDQIIDLPANIEANAGETLLIMHKVPDNVTDTSVLLFETEFQNIVVTIGEEKMYSNGVLTEQEYMKNAVPCQNIISIGSAKPGDVVCIYIASAYNKYSGKIGSISYGTKGDAKHSKGKWYLLCYSGNAYNSYNSSGSFPALYEECKC